MAVGRITKRAVDALPPPSGGKRAYLWDDTLKGFGCMVTSKGAKSYIIQYRVGGRGSQTRRVTIGRHGSPWTPDRARDRAAELLEQVRRKIDPFDAEREAVKAAKKASDERAEQEAAKLNLAFSLVADAYMTGAKKSLRRWQEQQAVIDRDLRPAFANTPLPDIAPDDISEHLAKVAERSPSASLKAYIALRAIYAHAHKTQRKLFPASKSPFAEVTRPEAGGKRDRHLNNAEVRLMWEASKVLGWPFGPIYQLLLLTGIRETIIAHEFSGDPSLDHQVQSQTAIMQDRDAITATDPLKLGSVPRAAQVRRGADLLFRLEAMPTQEGGCVITQHRQRGMPILVDSEQALGKSEWADLVDDSWWLYENFASVAVRQGWGAQGLWGVRVGVPYGGGLAQLLRTSRSVLFLDGIATVTRLGVQMKRNRECGHGCPLMWEVG